MAKLPGWLFMVAGAIVVAYTKYIESKRDAHLGLFFWAGIAFIAYGFLKEVLGRIGKQKPKPEPAGPPPKREQELDHRHPAGQQFHGRSPHETHQHTKPHPQTSHPHQPAQRSCPRCHAVNVGHANFCHGCGQRF